MHYLVNEIQLLKLNSSISIIVSAYEVDYHYKQDQKSK